MTYAEHAERARFMARKAGAYDCIHYAPNWDRRADALYKVANDSGVAWWEDGQGSPYLLLDGRMIVAGKGVWFFEPKEGS